MPPSTPTPHADAPAAGAGVAGPMPRETSGRRPVTLVAVCGLVLLEAGALVGLAGAWVVEVARGAARLAGPTIFLILFALGVAAVLVLAARGLWRGRRWARSPVMTWQVLLVVVSVGWTGAEASPWVLVVVLVGLLVGVGLLLPSVVAATVEAREPG